MVMSEVARPPVEAGPIVKWVGGKTKLLPELLKRVPSSFGRYFEPFAGGAALFFAMQPQRAVLGDMNAGLVDCYRIVRDAPGPLCRLLEEHVEKHSEEHYYATRALWNERKEYDRFWYAAAFLYLNRACFNGVWRVNKRGCMNVPFGKAPAVRFDYENLRAASYALQNVELIAGSYIETVARARADDFVFLDPPYDATFNGYTKAGTFDQEQLAGIVRSLIGRGVRVMLSNSDTPRIRELYADMRIEIVRCPRAVNSNGHGRGDVNEVLVTA